MKLIDPKPGHMYTYITASVYLRHLHDQKQRRLLKKCRIYKSFHFSLVWMDGFPYGRRLSSGAHRDYPTNRSGKRQCEIYEKYIQCMKEKK